MQNDWTRLPARTSFAPDRVLDLLSGMEQFLHVDQLCADVGLPYDRLQAPATRVPGELVIRLLERAADVSGDSLLGLHLAAIVHPRSVLTYLTQAQMTLGEAFALFCQFQHLTLPGPSIVIVERGPARMLLAFPSDPSMDCRLLTEFFLARVRLEGGRNVDPPLRPDGVRFRHARAGNLTEYERVFGCPVRFEQPEDALLIPASAFEDDMKGWNDVVASLALRPARAQAELASNLPFRERVALALRSLLLAGSTGDPVTTARSLALTPQTLQRQLWTEGTSFRTVRGEVQREVALTLLAIPTLTAEERATHCGFASVDELAAAVRRWSSPRN